MIDGVPDMIGEVVAWRAWIVVEPRSRHPRLRSANAAGRVGLEQAIWPTNRWLYAICPSGHSGDEVPASNCSCGLYAAKSLEHLLTYGYATLQGSEAGPTVIGEVGFAGRVIEGSQGWKAQRGRVVRLYLPFSQQDLGERLAEAYNVPYELAPWWATNPRLLALNS